MSDLETTVAATENILPLEEYTKRFNERYHKETRFKQIVHVYLNLSRGTRFGLGFKSIFMPGSYKKQTEEIIATYAQKIYQDLEEARKLKQQFEILKEKEKEEKEAREAARTAEEERRKALTAAEQLRITHEEKQQNITRRAQEEQTRIATERVTALQTIKEKTDIRAFLAKKVREKMLATGLITADEAGSMRFDAQKIVNKLEDMALDNVIEEIEQDDGRGFLRRIQNTYDGLIEYYSSMEDWGELPDVDWRATIIQARRNGRMKPRYQEDFITGKRGGSYQRVQPHIDSAITMDVSGSMDGARLEMARKTSFATRALMRRLHPDNQNYLSVFNERVREIQPMDLETGNVQAGGGTNTEYALDWLINTLADKKPSIAYLITDGEPNNLDSTIKAAQRFRDYPHIFLRIFLIDCSEAGIANVRQFGNAAGPETKVIPVKDYQLATGVIRDLPDVLNGMYSVSSF
ncbi:MAG: hypothetical protein Q7R96_06075 [Nanoarchaeota archaeon]|nr:hypothetical protein [Nanoarchaeota archaeon]